MTSATAAFLLMILQGPIPLFVLPMPSAPACSMNMKAMRNIITEKAVVGCFDVVNQVWHFSTAETHDERLD